MFKPQFPNAIQKPISLGQTSEALVTKAKGTRQGHGFQGDTPRSMASNQSLPT
jgi:hypothetical protein